jgi:hypothetical protein
LQMLAFPVFASGCRFIVGGSSSSRDGVVCGPLRFLAFVHATTPPTNAMPSRNNLSYASLRRRVWADGHHVFAHLLQRPHLTTVPAPSLPRHSNPVPGPAAVAKWPEPAAADAAVRGGERGGGACAAGGFGGRGGGALRRRPRRGALQGLRASLSVGPSPRVRATSQDAKLSQQRPGSEHVIDDVAGNERGRAWQILLATS